MNNSIKGFYPREKLKQIPLQTLHIETITGEISQKQDILEIFECELKGVLIDISSIPFNELTLNIMKYALSFKIIGIDGNSNGVFLKYTHNFTIPLKNFSAITKGEILILDGDINISDDEHLTFSIVIGLILSPEKFTSIKPIPLQPLKVKEYFNKEFI